jgi:thiol-disulfide isomerase/thioredoxin
LAGVLLAAAGASHAQEAGGDKGDVKVVKHAGYADVVTKNRGKVVVVDFWHVYCAPCIAGMPHLVALHKKHARDGLVIVTVDIDPSFGRDPLPRIEEKVRKLVRDKGLAPLTNLILDESDKVVEEKLRVESAPCVFVFDRGGTLTRFEGEAASDHKAVDALVVKLLAAK